MNLLLLLTLISGGWKTSLTSSFNITEAFYNNQWQKEDVSNITWNIQINGEASKGLSKALFLKNRLSLLYGQTFVQDATTGNWQKPVKSQDKIEEESILSLRKGWPVDPYVSLYFLSQFFDEPDTMYINPMTFQESFGFEREIIKDESNTLSSRFGLALKQSINRKDSVPASKEGGMEWITHGKFKISKASVYEMNLRVFKALMSNQPDSVTTWKAPDVSFENLLTVSVSKYINMNAYLLLFYDKDQIDAVQLKQTMSIGVTFNLL